MKRVLICDDAVFMRNVLRDLITKAGYCVVGEASDGYEAVEQYKLLKPDVVTMDITMPKKDGISAVRDIKSFDPNANVIMCSAMGQKTMVIDAIKAGARDFIVKPFEKERVLQVLQKV